jgi:hypothetical protein
MQLVTDEQMNQVSGGTVLEKEGLYPRKFGYVEYALYIDGAYIGTGYGAPAHASSTLPGNSPTIEYRFP